MKERGNGDNGDVTEGKILYEPVTIEERARRLPEDFNPFSPDWLLTKEAASLTGYHPDTLAHLARMGKVEGCKWTRDWYLRRDSILAYAKKMGKL